MGLVLKKNSLPYKSLIFNYRNYDTSDIFYNDTGLTWTILSTGTGQLTITADQTILLQKEYCVIVTPIRVSNNHSINVLTDGFALITDIIRLYCCENNTNALTDDGFNQMTVQINFFNL
jgi:hypothetical protein